MTVSSLAGLVPHQSAHRPDAEALVEPARRYTWGQLDLEIGRLAAALLAVGVEPGEWVGVHHHKSADAFIAMHAVVRIGAVAVPLDPGSPTDRLVSLCDDLGLEFVVTHPPRARAIADVAAAASLRAVLGVDEAGDAAVVTAGQIAALDPVGAADLDPSDAAYVITTSGSTGEPKAIVHTHTSALAYARLAVDAFALGSEDRVTDIAPNHFDQSTFALWSVPLAGAVDLVVPEPYQRLPASLSQLISDERATMWYSVPFLLQQVVERGDLSNRDLSAMRLVQLGGEVISTTMLEDFFEAAPQAVVANVYGPAEVNQCSHHSFDRSATISDQIPIGRPSAGCDFRLVEPGSTNPQAEVADRGELWVASPAMMRGYAGRTEEQSDIVVDAGRRWYRTGDLASVDGDGIYTFDGRADNQVKVRGHRIELEWVEAVLETHPDVSSAVVAVRRADDGADVVVAGIVEASADVGRSDVRDFAASKLPAYAVPAHIAFVNGAETTGSGKLDRRALRERLLAVVDQGEVEGKT